MTRPGSIAAAALALLLVLGAAGTVSAQSAAEDIREGTDLAPERPGSLSEAIEDRRDSVQSDIDAELREAEEAIEEAEEDVQMDEGLKKQLESVSE